nr:immunoglobulin light chain junction region [Macaca mulatta]MOV99388.1 immunoglobulin light chain junction region [Macaca mulatta]MOW00004.1 immunoglobulin light chain junction region [Macaca mulatta]MOW01061.1 immunoglobulin light chain junction region [Macaca mulatta]MOW01092.1 immunoglobulin light chain junction region [Macaca mulatta]
DYYCGAWDSSLSIGLF